MITTFVHMKGQRRNLDEKEFLLEKLAGDIVDARNDLVKGKIHTQEQIMKEFGL